MPTRRKLREHADGLVAEMQKPQAGVFELRLPLLHEKQRAIAECAARVRVVCCGRRYER